MTYRSRLLVVAKGARVQLRFPVRTDLDEWVELRRTSWRFLRAAEPAPATGSDPNGPEAFQKVLETAIADRSRRLFVCSNDGGGILGQISFSDISRGPFQSAYIGYWIGRAHGGRGLMTEALVLAVDFAFQDLNLHRLEANIRPTNAASLALVERCGFQREGYARRLLRIAGRWHDHERWAVISEDWRPKKASSSRMAKRK